MKRNIVIKFTLPLHSLNSVRVLCGDFGMGRFMVTRPLRRSKM